MHLQQLNGLNRPNRASGSRNAESGRSPAYSSGQLTPEYSSIRHLNTTPVPNTPFGPSSSTSSDINNDVDIYEPLNESNGSISNILRSVLYPDSFFPSALESEMENQLNHLLNENSIDYERITNFSAILKQTDEDL